jgi:hypothetical protein
VNTPQDPRSNYDWVYAIIPVVILWLYALPSKDEFAQLKREMKILEQQMNQLQKAVRK